MPGPFVIHMGGWGKGGLSPCHLPPSDKNGKAFRSPLGGWEVKTGSSHLLIDLFPSFKVSLWVLFTSLSQDLMHSGCLIYVDWMNGWMDEPWRNPLVSSTDRDQWPHAIPHNSLGTKYFSRTVPFLPPLSCPYLLHQIVRPCTNHVAFLLFTTGLRQRN